MYLKVLSGLNFMFGNINLSFSDSDLILSRYIQLATGEAAVLSTGSIFMVFSSPAAFHLALSSFPFVVWFQKLQQELEFLEVQEEYIKDEQKNLKKEFLHAQEEVKRIQSIPLVIGQFLEAVDQNTAIVGSTTGAVIGTISI